MIECVAAIPENMPPQMFPHLIADYLKVNRFIMDVIRIQGYSPNSHLTVTEIASPRDIKQ